MIKEYELWLDESGAFENENLLKRRRYHPSLIGGFLIEQEKADTIAFLELIDESRTHAMELAQSDKVTYILPILEKMRDDYHAREVFFENSEYEDAASNRQLYLKIMAEGLLQLIQTLNAEHECVVLNVLIAQRQDVTASAGRRRIGEQEYLDALQSCIAQKRKERRIILHEGSELRFEIAVANREKKLQLADFACNTRLTRNSKVFETERARIAALYTDAYLFSLYEVGSENFIKQSLAQGCIADAILELYTTRDALNHKKFLKIIIDRMKTTSYRLVKSQLKQCGADLIAYAARQYDFEVGEALLKDLNKKLIPLLKEAGQPYLAFQFTLLLYLTDMYLREGDISAAREVLQNCREVQEEMGNQLEEVFSYYQLLEKESLLAISSFDYETGKKIMEQAGHGFSTVIKAIMSDEFLSQRFKNMNSEYYGHALCMQIYAMMFLQRKTPELYGELCNLSDFAMTQYPEPEAELERQRQYRSHIEMEAGNYQEALKWLFKAKLYYPKEVTKESMIEFLNRVCDTEVLGSCRYYLMYYLLIQSEAKLAGMEIADEMYQALCEQKRLMETAELNMMSGYDDGELQSQEEVNMEAIKEMDSGVYYHPDEIINWKYATYLLANGRAEKALMYYTKAVKICFTHKNYEALYVIGFGINAEKIYCLAESGNCKGAKKEYKNLIKKTKTFLEEPRYESVASLVKDMLNDMQECRQEDGRVDWSKLAQVSRKITY